MQSYLLTAEVQISKATSVEFLFFQCSPIYIYLEVGPLKFSRAYVQVSVYVIVA